MHIYTALVQLFRVSVSASANGRSSSASHDQLVVSSYARPLGATLVAFGMAVLVMGESRHFSFALPCACMRICRRYNTRHAKVFPHSASSAAGALPSRPPQRVSAGRLTRDTSRDRIWYSRRGALSPLCRSDRWATVGVMLPLIPGPRAPRAMPSAIPPSLIGHPQVSRASPPFPLVTRA